MTINIHILMKNAYDVDPITYCQVDDQVMFVMMYSNRWYQFNTLTTNKRLFS